MALNSSGATTSSQAYGPFGETEGTPASRFGYTGQQYLAPLGLYYYKARMYSPVLGRFLQTDPIGYKDDLNWYAYVGNNPINATDPSGLAGQCSTNNLMGVQSKIQPIPTPAAITNSWSHQQSANLSDALSQGVVGPGIGAGVVKGIGVAAKGMSKADAVIAGTLAGKGNLTSATKLSSNELLQAGEKFLGPGYKEIGKPGSGVFRNADGTRQFRIDGNSLSGNPAPGVPHGHLETYAPGAAKPAANNHIPFFD